ncbi:xylulokinase [Bacillus cihuensis]|uniref:xylulokinase n=1 Tax=Bacillus cihuensis TaxID=1208599 RepID=UPI0003F4C5D3|nr:xylulokinase [Bacillus cihuensis]
MFLGIDIGSGGTKVILLNKEGKMIESCEVSYSFDVPKEGWTEHDPEEWWLAVKKALKTLFIHNDPSFVEAIGVTGQMHSSVLLDANGEVIRKAILWNDQRTEKECKEVLETIGEERFRSLTMNTLFPGFTLPKIIWLKRNEPEAYKRIATIMMPKDFINYKLTGVMATEVTDASGTGIFDVYNRKWNKDLIHELGFNPEWFPPVFESIDVIGEIGNTAASAIGLKEGIPVVAGAADNAAAAIGNGVFNENKGLISVGTSGVVLVPINNRPDKELLTKTNSSLHIFCHALPNTWYAMGVTLTAGESLKWFRKAFELEEDYEELILKAKDVKAGANGLIFTPYLSGERTPHNDSTARGGFYGLNLTHRKGDFVRAVLEGVSYSLKDCHELIKNIASPESFVITGGAIKSEIWSQILSDVIGVKLKKSARFEGPAIGAAILAGMGIGFFRAPDEVTNGADDVIITPRTDHYLLYKEGFHKYQNLYKQLSSK